MRKLLLIIFCAVANLGSSQTKAMPNKSTEPVLPLNRLIYERYFKHLYKYEPGIIRENKIEYLETKEFEKIGDSIVSSSMKEKVYFRSDGRPIRMITQNKYYSNDSTITDYSYDSLGNLVEFRYYYLRDGYKGPFEVEIGRQNLQYDGKRLVKSFRYSKVNGDNYLTLSQCDSLGYQFKKSKLFIITGNANNEKIVYSSKPTFVYPINTHFIHQLNFSGNNLSEKPIDIESIWEKACSYSNPVLRQLQVITGAWCFNTVIVEACRQAKKNEVPYDKDELTLEGEKSFFGEDSYKKYLFCVDTSMNRIYVKLYSGGIQPTSLEAIFHNAVSINTYDYDMRLLQTESVSESSRGTREYGKDSSQTYYTYFNFGLVHKKVTFHHFTSFFSSYDVSHKEPQQKKDYSERIREEVAEIKIRTK